MCIALKFILIDALDTCMYVMPIVVAEENAAAV